MTKDHHKKLNVRTITLNKIKSQDSKAIIDKNIPDKHNLTLGYSITLSSFEF